MAEDGDASHPKPPPGSSDGSDFAPSTSKHNANEDQSNLVPPDDDGERKEKALIEANEMMSSGLDAVNKHDYKRAVVCYSCASRNRATHLGEDAIDSAKAYHEYGRALLNKVKQEADPTSSLARKDREFHELYIEFFDAATESSDASGYGEELFGAEKDQSDLDLANKILAKARDIVREYVEKEWLIHVHESLDMKEEALELYDVFSAFVEVNLAREDFENAEFRYLDTLLLMAHVVDYDCTQVTKLNSKMCIYLASDRPLKASLYCHTAMTGSMTRMQFLVETGTSSSDPEELEACTREIKQYKNLFSKLNHKLDDLLTVAFKENPGLWWTPDTEGSNDTPSTSGTAGGSTETPSTSGTAGGSTETPLTSGTAGGSTETPLTSGTAGGSTETASPSGTGGSTQTPSTSDTGYAGEESDQGSEGRGLKRDHTGPPVDPSPTKKPAFDSP